ncbi:MAG: CPBP family intramembrane metalloprotease [Actinomycetota bacterium]|nr:CPBP family intramembrane metalloprotease [Actinomycetota bacterium]
MESARSEAGGEGWRLGVWFGIVGLLIFIAYAARASGGDPDADALYQYETAVSGIVIYGMLLGFVFLLARGLPKEAFFALRRPESWSKALGLALGAYVTIFIGAGLILIALDAGDEQGLTPEDWDPDRAGQYAANFVAVALVAPIVEELLYRGAGMTLLARWGVPAAVIVTSLGFGLGHGLVLALPALVLFGLVTAALRHLTASVYPCILVHCAFNATSLIVSVAA